MRKVTVTRGDRQGWLDAVWAGLHEARDAGAIPDEPWDEVCTAMAWIREELGLPEEVGD